MIIKLMTDISQNNRTWLACLLETDFALC